jgi:hypothetical protein
MRAQVNVGEIRVLSPGVVYAVAAWKAKGLKRFNAGRTE